MAESTLMSHLQITSLMHWLSFFILAFSNGVLKEILHYYAALLILDLICFIASVLAMYACDLQKI